MKSILLAFIFSFFLFSSCGINISDELKNMLDKEINYDKLIPNMYGHDILNGNIKPVKKDARLIVYYDSTICQSCRLNKIGEWDNILELQDSFEGKFEVMFIFSPTETECPYVKRYLATRKFPYLVWFDKNNSFLDRNSIPSDNRFHVFLVNENNKVVFVGDPLYNVKLYHLFFDTLSKLISEQGEYCEAD